MPIVSINTTPNSICAGDAIILNATSAGATLNWSNGVINNVTFTPTATATYTVTASSTINTACTQTATKTIVVNNNITPALSIASSITQGGTGDPIIYTATTNVPLPYTINWYRNSVFQTSTTANVWNTNIVSGANNVQARINSLTQCLLPDSASSNILEIKNVTAVSNIVIEGLSIYPNPVKNVITIDGLQINDIVKMYNNVGQIVVETTGATVMKNNNKIDVVAFANGTYFLHVIRNEMSNIYKVVK